MYTYSTLINKTIHFYFINLRKSWLLVLVLFHKLKVDITIMYIKI